TQAGGEPAGAAVVPALERLVADGVAHEKPEKRELTTEAQRHREAKTEKREGRIKTEGRPALVPSVFALFVVLFFLSVFSSLCLCG
ncbi:MAG TPA: hypothetical protein VFA26_00570, partial [Gemmataceae bacterium]|nr:hypothetical protein [Gemmataceae bacterium]